MSTREPLYGRERWRRMAKRQLRDHPLCAKCLEQGIVRAAKVADHIEPHKGDSVLFWSGALQSLCWSCHKRTKYVEEIRGYTSDIDAEGWPTDPRHPANARRL